MAVEQAVASWRGVQVYRPRGTVGDLANSLGNILGQGLFGLTTFIGYEAVLRHGSVGWFPTEGLHAWLLAFLLVDLGFYWRHRACHRVGVLWAIHEVHHQSREFNLGTAQRAPWLQSLPNIPLGIAFAWLGVPLEMVMAAFLVKALWGFYTHTTLVGRLGPLEAVFVTPSHHRVHHACDDAYLDRNYGNTLIVWDRLFGTFAVDKDAPTYGVRAERAIDDPWSSNVDPFVELWDRARTAPTAWGFVETFLRPPGWDPRTRRVGTKAMATSAEPQRGPWERVAAGFLAVLATSMVALSAGLSTWGGAWVGAVLFVALLAVTRGASAAGTTNRGRMGHLGHCGMGDHPAG